MSDRPIPTIANERKFLHRQCLIAIKLSEHETDSLLPITIKYESPLMQRTNPKKAIVVFAGTPRQVIDLIEDFTRRVDQALVA